MSRALSPILLVGAALIAVAGLVRLASDAQQVFDDGRDNRRGMDEDYGQGDDTGYQEGMATVKPQIKATAKILEEQFEDQYIYGPVGDIGGAAVDGVAEGYGNAVPIIIQGAKEVKLLP
jgi:hypothetical protein